MEKYFTVEHHALGRGYAILTKYRLRKEDDLFMCCFGGEYMFYCRKHLLAEDEVWFVDPDKKPRKRRKTRQQELEDQLRAFFSSAQG